MVCGRHGCGRYGHCLWPSLSNCVNNICDRLIEEDDDGSRVLVELTLSETKKSDTVIPLDQCPDLPRSGESGFVKFSESRSRFMNTSVYRKINFCVEN